MTTVTNVISTLDTMASFANTYTHALAHKGTLLGGADDVLHSLTAHADELVGVSPLMATAAADDVRQAVGIIEKLSDSYATSSYKFDQAKALRNALQHATSHLR